MSRFVVEPSVMVKWFVPETDSDSAARLLDGGHELLAADTAIQEAAGIIAAKAGLGELTAPEALEVLEAVRSVPMRCCPTEPILGPALEISMAIARPLPEGIALALAVQNDCRLVTARRSLFRTASASALSRFVKWVGDIK